MKIKIVSLDTKLTDDMRGSVENLLNLVLGRFADRIANVMVHLSDVNNPHHKAATKVRIEVILVPAKKIIIEDQDADLTTAINRAAKQLARSVKRRLEQEADGLSKT